MSQHPLEGLQVKVSHFKGFGETPTGFDEFKPINVIIGRNNTGKSALIDALELCISEGASFAPLKHGRDGKMFKVFLTQPIDQFSIGKSFSDSAWDGEVPGNHRTYAQRYIGKPITRTFGSGWQPKIVDDAMFNEIRSASQIKSLNQSLANPLKRLKLMRLAAERDVQSEEKDKNLSVLPNGKGTTNLIRAFINNDNLPRDAVEVQLLNDLNAVYSGDSEFSNILVRESDEDIWEIHLREKDKGDIRLSQSGSSLKSVFIILAMLRLIPHLDEVNWSNVIFAVEEPENNLHPALLRRLLEFLATERYVHSFTMLITTHSPICIDWSSKRDDSQIIHVQQKDGYSTSRKAISYSDARDILDDLDIRASDILQANGVIWVEGPSDRIYVNRWLDLISDGSIIEGVHYTIMFYGGKVLSHFDCLPPDKSKALVSLISLNRNAALIMDSDRHPGGGKPLKSGKARQPRMNLNETKNRIVSELNRIGGLVWVTAGREVENYVPAHVFERVVGKAPPAIGIYDQIPSLSFLSQFSQNKVNLAHAVANEMRREDLDDHLNLVAMLESLANRIRRWNGM